jgi:hypothetical protein
MDVSSAFSEFIVPGVIVTGSATLFLMDTGIGYQALHQGIQELGAVTVAVFLLCVSYVAGILCSELGTALVRRHGNQVAKKEIEGRLTELRVTPWATQIRGQGRALGWSDFSYLRAAARAAEGARSRIQSHENILRILRSCLVALPLTSFFIAVYAMRNSGWPTVVDYLFVPACVGVVGAGAFLAFHQRLGVAVRSAIDHYLAVSLIAPIESPEKLITE